MNNRPSSKRRARVRGTSRIALLALAALLFPASTTLAGAPDWLRAAAREPLPAYPKDTKAVIVFSELVISVKDNGEIEILHRCAYKILRPEGRDYGTFSVFFDKDTRLTYLKAWSIPADGKEYEVKEKDAVETGITDFELYVDTRHKILRIPAADPGNVVGYEYVQKQRPFILQDQWPFQERIPVRRARFTLQLPSGWEYDSSWINYAQQKPQTAGSSQFVWDLENVPAVEIEPQMPPWGAVAGRLEVKYFPRNPAQASQGRGSWHDLGVWYAGLTVSSRQATPEIKQKVAELTSAASTLLDKMKALTSFLQRQIRYVAIEIGIGGYQPHAASDVFLHKYGDCKDKVTLLSSMLHEIGVESYYVIINSERGIALPEFPSALAFNHVILAIRLPEGVPTEDLYAAVNHPKLGRLLFFDPTDPYTPLGYLPSSLQANYGLLVTPDGGELIALPLLAPSTNRLLRTAKFSVTTSGTLSGEVHEIRWGAPAVEERVQFLQATAPERSKVLENYLGGFLAGSVLTGAAVGNLEQYDAGLTLTYRFVVENYAKTAGNLLMLRPRVLGEKGSLLLEEKERKYPVEFREATLQSDVFEIALPPGYVVDELPPPTKVSYDFGAYSSEMAVEGNTLRYKRTYEIKDVRVPTQSLDSLKKFFRQIAADERSSAILRRANP